MAVIWNEFIWKKTSKQQLDLSSGKLGYEVHGDYLVFCAHPTIIEPQAFWSQLEVWRSECHKTLCGYYLTEGELQRLEVHRHTNFLCQQIGVRRVFESKNFNLHGQQFEEVRRSLIKGVERGLVYSEFSENEKFDRLEEVQSLYREWKSNKGPLDLEFFITPIVWGPHVEQEKWIGVNKKGRLVAFASLIPVGGFSFYVDHMIFDKSEAKWSMNFLFAKLIEELPIGGSLDFGLCPLANIHNNFLLEKASQASEFLPLSYNFKGLYEFKKKFTNKEEPCFALLQKNHSKLKQYKAMLEVSVNRLRYLVSF